MATRLNWRRIGSVNIFELESAFSDSWIPRVRKQMGALLQRCPANGLLFNMAGLERVDEDGATCILETVRESRKGGILGQNLSSFFVAEQMDPAEPLPIFETKSEAIMYFGKELAQTAEGVEQSKEKRLFPRIETALPVSIECREDGKVLRYEAVVLNLSEGGLCARFLDSQTENLAVHTLDPFDLRILALKLSLPGNRLVRAEGKVLRDLREQPGGSAFAVEFYNLQAGGRHKIQNFLESAAVK